jgi:DNA-binding NarL/FixJ family response regulator
MENDEENMYQSSGVEDKTRHKVAIDTLSLLDDDGRMPSAEEEGSGTYMYKQIIQTLDTEREKFIAIAIDHGFENVEIAFMLNLHPSQITRGIQKIRIKLSQYQTKARI